MIPWWNLLLGVILNAGGALTAVRVSALSRSGGIAAFLVGIVIYLTMGLAGWLLLMAFFISSSALSRLKNESKLGASAIHEKDSARDVVQVAANGGVAAAAGLVAVVFGSEAATIAFVAALAAANADTWAGEIGMLSPRRPRSILTLRPVPTGRSGGVTILGTAAAAAGAGFISLVAAALGIFQPSAAGLLRTVITVTAAGFLGSLVDSVLGTTAQARYRDSEGRITEKRGTDNTRAGGIAWVTNDAVNVASGAVAAVIAAVVSAAV